MASSSSGPEFFVPGHCSEFDMKLFLRHPALAGRDQLHYTNLPGLPMHSQVITRSHNQCCPASTHQPVFSSVPVRYNSLSNCSRCRGTNESVVRRVPTGHHSHVATSVNSCWINPVEAGPSRNLNNTNLMHSPSRIQPCVPSGHVGMATVAPMDGVPYNMSALYHHHHHIHHYHHYTHSRNNLHPYALPVFHPRLQRQPSIHPLLPHNFLLPSEAQVTMGRNLDRDPLENSVDIRELFADLKPKGISKSVLENLPTYRVASKDKRVTSESRCAICLMDFEQKQQLRILPCLHEYHSKCIDKWLKNNRSCPICRKEIKIS